MEHPRVKSSTEPVRDTLCSPESVWGSLWGRSWTTLSGAHFFYFEKHHWDPGQSLDHSENSIVSAFFRVSLVNESAGYNQRPAGYNQRPLVNFRCGLGGPQKPERRSTRYIVAFERHTARVLPATIAEIRFGGTFSTNFRKVLRSEI